MAEVCWAVRFNKNSDPLRVASGLIYRSSVPSGSDAEWVEYLCHWQDSAWLGGTKEQHYQLG
jgi:hypothetical protein